MIVVVTVTASPLCLCCVAIRLELSLFRDNGILVPFPTDRISIFLVMLLAALVSAFCSAAEAVFFSLSSHDRREFQSGSRFQRMAAGLAAQSGKILPALLLCNLTANLILFACSTIVAIDLKNDGHAREAGLFVLATLFGVIIVCEITPKSLGVTIPRLLAPLMALPLSLLTCVIAPAIPFLEQVNLLTQRLFFPNLKPESHLQVSDLERMIELTPSRKKQPSAGQVARSLSLLPGDAEQPATLLKREQQVLRNIIGLSDATAEEMMRPRTRLRLFKPPVTLASLQGRVPPGGYLLITEPDTDEIASAIPLDRFTGGHGSTETIVWDAQSNSVVYVPWRMKASHVLETLQKEKKEVAAVVNEYGETIGILTFDDLVYSIFALVPSRSRLLFKQAPIRRNGEGCWLVSTMTTLRRIARYFQCELPEHEPSTVGGILEETLERFPQEDDQCDWGPFHWHVLARNASGIFDVEITFHPEEDEP